MNHRFRYWVLFCNAVIGLLLIFPGEDKLAANILVACLAFSLWVFIIIFLIFWWKDTREDKALLISTIGFASLSTFSTFYYWDPFPMGSFDLGRGILYLLCLIGVINFTLLLAERNDQP